ncbi:MAG: PhzF family phenazine biosynthesis protein [Woeseiaceae bacterium]|nr:PhzF family phenazine biosynthesis protein [Woeseiaceae bacterium]
MNAAGGQLHRLAAFADAPGGGNPAGVWIGDALPDDAQMLAIAADVGYSETAFVAPASGRRRNVRYFSAEAEVSFCGHATIATGVVLARDDGPGRFELETAVGRVPVIVRNLDGSLVATLESVEPRDELMTDEFLDAALAAIGWARGDIDDALTPARAYAGAWHGVIAVRDRNTLGALDYDYDALKSLMLDDNLTTMQLVWRENQKLFHARDPFPVGGVVEDPATGAAAAALGGYLRNAGLIRAPASLTILQGYDMGRPSRLQVEIPPSGGILVSGTAVSC